MLHSCLDVQRVQPHLEAGWVVLRACILHRRRLGAACDCCRPLLRGPVLWRSCAVRVCRCGCPGSDGAGRCSTGGVLMWHAVERAAAAVDALAGPQRCQRAA